MTRAGFEPTPQFPQPNTMSPLTQLLDGPTQHGLNLVFFSVLLFILIQHPSIFHKRHGKYHRLFGLFHLLWLLLGFYQSTSTVIVLPYLYYDVILGLSGTFLALTAAWEFQHKGIENSGSGTLDEHATVTYEEMIEHSFYQGLNVVQILFLHGLSMGSSFSGDSNDKSGKLGVLLWGKIGMVVIATMPWLIRPWFPINKFSDNYTKIDRNSTNLIRVLYRIKKYQYVFYKHFLLHGLLISVALSNDDHLIEHQHFRMYWLLLNTSYVMEFFLQTLVKKKRMSQTLMLVLQHILMLSATLSSLFVLSFVRIDISLASMIANFVNRKNDFFNTVVILLVSAAVLRGDELFGESVKS